MTVALTISVEGVEPIVERIGGIEERLDHLQPGFEAVADLLEPHTQATFESQGSRIGQAWKALAPSTVRARANRWGYYGAHPPRDAGPASPILVWTRRLKHSFRRGGTGHLRVASDSSLTWGSGLPYGKYHQAAGPRSRLPRRVMLGFKDEFQAREILFQPIRMYLQGVPPGEIKTDIAPRVGLPLV